MNLHSPRTDKTIHPTSYPRSMYLIYIELLGFVSDDGVSFSSTHTYIKKKKNLAILLSIYLCVLHTRSRSVSYSWFGFAEPVYILPFLTLHVATGWVARWAYAVAWWEII